MSNIPNLNIEKREVLGEQVDWDKTVGLPVTSFRRRKPNEAVTIDALTTDAIETPPATLEKQTEAEAKAKAAAEVKS